MAVNHLGLWRFDLNLLVAFDALMTEKSVTRAAERLSLGQPATSHLLRRLRTALDDPLFVRTQAGLEPTPLARRIYIELRPLLDKLDLMIARRQTFQPEDTQRVFRLAMPDLLEPTFLLPLMKRVEGGRSGISFLSYNCGGAAALDLLDRDIADVAINYFPALAPSLSRTPLFLETYRCVYDKRRGPAPRTLSAFLSRPHVLAKPVGIEHDRVSEALARTNIEPRIIIQTSNYLEVGFLVSNSDAIATVPDRLFRPILRSFRLSSCKPPFEINTFTISLVWHKRWTDDPGNQWLRDQISQVVSDIADAAPAPLRDAAVDVAEAAASDAPPV